MKLMINSNIIINIPNNTKIIIWYNKKTKISVWLLNNLKTYKISFINLKKYQIFFDKWNNCLCLNNINCLKHSLKIENLLNSFLYSWNLFFFKKIKFKGKGFRIKFFKKINLIKFYFGKSHKTFLFLKKIKKKKINKYKFILFGLNVNFLCKNSLFINKIKNINLYTLRGLRLSRQIIYKRKGKKGTYI